MAKGLCMSSGCMCSLWYGKIPFFISFAISKQQQQILDFSQWATKDEQSSFKKHCSYTISRLDLLKKRCENWYGKEIWEEIPLGITRRSGMYFLQYMKHPAKKIQMFSYVNVNDKSKKKLIFQYLVAVSRLALLAKMMLNIPRLTYAPAAMT